MILQKKTIAGILLAGLATTILGGCTSLSEYPCDVAWKKIETRTTLSRIVEIFLRDENGEQLINENPFEAAKEEAEAAARSAATPVQALDEIVDQVSQHLVLEMPQHAKNQGSQWRLTLAVGTLVDGTEDRVLGSALNRVARNLERNADFRQHFKVLASEHSDAEAILEQLSGAHPDDIYEADSDDSAGVATVHPDDLYVLTGRTDVFAEDQNKILRTVTLIDITHPKTNQIILSEEFRRIYYFHPGDRAYITAAEDERRRAARNSSN